MAALTSYTWKPIEDLPGDLTGLVQSELRSLSQIWMDQKAALEDVEGLRAFNERLKREWAIETGVLERLYTLDRGITQLLIERGIDAAFIPRDSTNRNPELVAAMIRDHESAVDFLFDFVKQQRSLSTSYIKELHALLTRHQASTEAIDTLGRRTEVPILKGTYKTLPNNPSRANGSVHEYCPPEHVASEMDRLLQLHEEHERRDVPPEVEAAWLHHRFTQIHPFQDGNGRVARCLATLVFVKAQWFPLVVTRDERERYILALRHLGSGPEPQQARASDRGRKGPSGRTRSGYTCRVGTRQADSSSTAANRRRTLPADCRSAGRRGRTVLPPEALLRRQRATRRGTRSLFSLADYRDGQAPPVSR